MGTRLVDAAHAEAVDDAHAMAGWPEAGEIALVTAESIATVYGAEAAGVYVRAFSSALRAAKRHLRETLADAHRVA